MERLEDKNELENLKTVNSSSWTFDFVTRSYHTATA